MAVLPPLTPDSRNTPRSFLLTSPRWQDAPPRATAPPLDDDEADEARTLTRQACGGVAHHSVVGYLVCKALDSKLLQTTVPVRDTGTNNEFRGMKSLWVAKGTTTGSKSLAGGGSGCTPRRPSTWCAVVALGRKSKTWRGAVRIGRALKSVLGVLFTVAGAALAVLIAFWSLYPICTRCQDSGGGNHERDGDGRRGSSAGAIALAEAERNVSSTLRINQLQVIGTHNSYHRRSGIPWLRDLWPYHFPSLTEQLDGGVRHVELDVHYDLKTGRWFVYHVSVVDPLSTCNCLSSCLDEIRQWSDKHPTHHIIFIDVELKLTGEFLRICGKNTPETDRTAFLDLQATVLDAFPRDRILLPIAVKGDYDTIVDAVTATGQRLQQGEARVESGGERGGSEVAGGEGSEMAGGWPLVDDTRGMMVLVMDYQSVNIDCRAGIRQALPLDETVFFERIPTNEVRQSPYAAFTQTCQCTGYWYRRTAGLVLQGLIVRQAPQTSLWVPTRKTAGGLRGLSDHSETYLADTPAQLLTSDNLKHRGVPGECRSSINPPINIHRALHTMKLNQMATPSVLEPPYRFNADILLIYCSRCSAVVPSESCILEGFC